VQLLETRTGGNRPPLIKVEVGEKHITQSSEALREGPIPYFIRIPYKYRCIKGRSEREVIAKRCEVWSLGCASLISIGAEW
jgi:hypothetical protein